MISALIATMCALGLAIPHVDSVIAKSIAQPPVIDGNATETEYGAPTLTLKTDAGNVRVWIVRHAGFLHIAASLPDSSYFWGDDLVVSIAPGGNSAPATVAGDRQWYLRRMIDSSVVSIVSSASPGRWMQPGVPETMLGTTRHHAEWDVAVASAKSSWSVELRVRESAVKTSSVDPRIAFRTYNNQPEGWWSWPAPPSGVVAHRVEHRPSLWIPIKFQ